MKFFSHKKNDYEKEIIEHIKGITEKTDKLRIIKLNNDLNDTFLNVIKFHDFGKYTSFFQNYLLNGITNNQFLHHHSYIGACTIFNTFKNINIKNATIAYYIIKQHHSNLCDLIESNVDVYKSNYNIVQNQISKQNEDLSKKLSHIKKELGVNLSIKVIPNAIIDLSTELFLIKNESNIQNYFLINYLFSLLIEADKLDASDTSIHIKQSIPIDIVDRYIKKLDKSNASLEQPKLREEVRKNVLRNFDRKDIDILKERLFTLTAPTGIGKTLTVLDFAINLKNKIKEKENREAQIIYALPFINIIEQSYEVYKNVLPDDIKLLAHYQYADAFEQMKEFDDSKNYNQNMMTLDTWQCDVVITSFVQFLQTLIGNRNKLLKKFNHYAGSIIILDEVQSIRLEQLPLVGASLYYLAKFLDARIILMTATKPKIFELTNEQILNNENEKAESFELLENYEEIFSKFHRTKLVPLLNDKLDENEFINKIFNEIWNKKQSVLIVVNKVIRSINLFYELETFFKNNGLSNPLYNISTNITPSERLYIIERIKFDLKFKKNPVLVSTQCIEAGVDLDFDLGFRDLAPIDSIIQVAGRVNRNNNESKKYSPIYIIDFGDCIKIYKAITDTQARKVFKKEDERFVDEIKEGEYLNLIEKYLNLRTQNNYQSYEESKNIFNSMKELRYDGDNENNPVSSFQVINNQQNVMSVFIELDDRATECKEMYLKLMDKKIKIEEFEPYKRDFNQRIIAVPIYYLNSLKLENNTTLSENIFIVPKELLSKYYKMKTGFIRKKEDEDENKIVML